MKLLFSLVFLMFTTCGANAFAEEMLESADSFKIEAVATPAPIPTVIKMPQNRPNLATWNMACIGVQWQNRDKPAGTTAGCANLMKEIDAFYTRNSRGKFNLVPVFAGEMKVPYDCNRKNQSLMATDIRSQLKVLRPELKLDVLILPQECTGPHAGGGTAHVKSVQRMTATHEVGHIVHFQHTGIYRKQPDGSFKNDAYADRDSIMGRIISNYLTAPQYYWNGWLNKDEYVLYTPETPEYLLKDIQDLTDKGGVITVIVPPVYAEGKYVFISMKRGMLKMHHAITGSWGGSIKINEAVDEVYDDKFSGLHVKVLRKVGKKVYVSIDKEPKPTPAPTTKPTSVPTRTPTILPTAAPTQTPKPTVLPTKTSAPVPTPTQTRTPTPPPVSVIPACDPTVTQTSAWFLFGPAINQNRTYHRPTAKEIAGSSALIQAMKISKLEGITDANDAKMVTAASNFGATICRVTKPDDSYLLVYARKGNSNYNGPNIIFREIKSSKIIVLGPHDDSDQTFAATKLAIQNTNALALISNGQKRHVNSDSDFMHHSHNLASKTVMQLNNAFPKSVWLHMHGMANPRTSLYRSRSKIFANAWEKAIKECTNLTNFNPRFNAYYPTEKYVKSSFYLKAEMPVRIYSNNSNVLACIIKDFEAKYSWAYEETVVDSSDINPDVSESEAEPEDDLPLE